MSFLLPSSIIDKIVPWFDRYLERRKKRQRELIAYLYKAISQIAPSVVLRYDQLHLEDMLIEIGDALLLIRSHFPSKRRQQAKHEAKIIRRLLDNKTLIDLPGAYTPPLSSYNEIRYNVALAKQLKYLEASH